MHQIIFSIINAFSSLDENNSLILYTRYSKKYLLDNYRKTEGNPPYMQRAINKYVLHDRIPKAAYFSSSILSSLSDKWCLRTPQIDINYIYTIANPTLIT